MPVLLLLVLACATGTFARPFNITHLIVPEVVPPNQDEVEIECRYDANFTLLNWFKGPNEFFRYRPGTAPSTRSFPILGVGKVEMLACGPTACRLKLGSLTEDATGLYRCDIERDVPPYKFEARSAYMQVHGHQARRPLLEGLAEEFEDEEEMQAYCRGAPDSELRWYINGREVEEMRGSPSLKRKASRWIFLGIPPVVTVQCAEFRYGKLSGSKEAKARWKNHNHKDERAQEQKNSSNITDEHLTIICILYCVSKIFN
ncbi:uncharacterized protein LOC126367086 [Pectinophora gossypiella]|uniref:uncharacterized protein LOC126367086 n=1 Tax=Pectinophora gossypiella TaxID=13191 RepID=UPI00214E15FC|nr:uncharacterized protein LOC126367086 [Pectinophora gossypiella]